MAIASSVAAAANAGVFRLEVRPSSQLLAGVVTVRVSMANRGDEAMSRLQPSVLLNGTWTAGPVLPDLQPGAESMAAVNAGPAPSIPGTYTAAIAVRYEDRNGHPFTSLVTIPVCTAEPLDRAPLSGTLDHALVRNSAPLALRLRSASDEPLAVQATLLLPGELAADNTVVPVDVPPGASATHTFHVRNGWAVDGSQYRIYVIADWLQAGRHASLAIPGTVSIPARREIANATMRRLWWIPGGLFGLYLLLQLRPTRRAAAGPGADAH